MSWLDAFRRDGFAILPGLLGAREVEALEQGFDRLLALAQTLPGTTDWAGSRFVLDKAPFRLHRVVWCGGADRALGRFGSDERLLEVASAALDSGEMVQIIQQAHYKLPGDGVGFRWHQDASNRRYGSEQWTDVDGRGSFVEIAVAVDPMRSDNGPLRMIPGSHRLGFVAHPDTGELPAAVLAEDEAVDVLLEPGDAVVFGPFVVHGSRPNLGTTSRRLFLQGFALPGANRRMYPGCGTGVARHLGPRT